MPGNFFLNDALGVCLAALLFPFFLLPPGYALGWLLNLLSFREQTPTVRLVWSLPLTIALTPILFYLLGRQSLGWPVWILFGLPLVATAALRPWRSLRMPRLAWAVSAFWALVVILSLADLQFGRRAYFSVVAFDYTFRSAVTGALVRATSLPAANPFFFPGHAEPFRYHYFWLLLCSLPSKLAQLDPRHSLIAGTIWAGFALFATVWIFLRFFQKQQASAKWAIALLFISGLDIFPVLLLDVLNLNTHQLLFPPTVDWWNRDQIAGWLDTMLWVPHNVAAIVACFMGFLILWHENRRRWQTVAAGALAFAGSAGLSIYVTLVFALCLIGLMIACLMRREYARVLAFAAAGVGAALLALPFFHELASAGGGSPLAIEIRHFSPIYLFAALFSIPVSPLFTLADFLALPLNYFLELGILFIVGIARWRRRDASDLPGTVMIAVSLIVCTIVKSKAAVNNDLGARGMLIVQFVLVLWGAQMLPGLLRHGRWRPITVAVLAFGAVTSIYEVTLLRIYPILLDAGVVPTLADISNFRDLGERTFSLRSVYCALDRTIVHNAVVQHNPTGLQDIFAGLYSNRQMAIMDLNTAIGFTGHADAARALEKPLEDLFAGKRDDADSLCRQLSIDYLIAKDVDPVWKDAHSWLWKHPILIRADRAAAVSCGLVSHGAP